MISERDDGANVPIPERHANNRLATVEGYYGTDWKRPDCGFDNECKRDVMMYGWLADERREPAAD